jgi:3-methyladenine DNA glycosylase AlkD
MTPTAQGFVAALHGARDPDQRRAIAQRLGPHDETHGIRMRDLFAAARAAAAMPLDEVGSLFASPLYEVRLGAICILDFRAKARRVDDTERRRLYDLYLGHHDRITTWDMVDRAAPSVVGGFLAGRSTAPLHDLARSPDPLRRRTAVTAPLHFVRHGTAQDVEAAFPLAAALAADPDPVVHKAVGILLKHAGARDAAAVVAFLDEHAARLPRVALRSAVDKLAPADRGRFMGQ